MKTDSQLQQDVMAELKWEPAVHAEQIGVEVKDGIVRVKGVTDEIAIKPGVTASVVKHDIEAALKRRATSEANGIKVAVNGSEVTLTGKVPTWAERDAAGSAAWSSPGVRNVIDNIAISY
jgi:osmotically-inducible protein OsmY